MDQPIAMPNEEILAELPVGESAIIQRLDFNERQVNRMAALGLCEGVRVTTVRVGDPMILRVYGTRIGLAKEWANGITIYRCPRGPITP